MMLRVQIREQAEKRRLRQADVAKLTGLSRVTISKYWLGKHVKLINVTSLAKIAKVLECTSLALVREDKESDNVAL